MADSIPLHSAPFSETPGRVSDVGAQRMSLGFLRWLLTPTSDQRDTGTLKGNSAAPP